jgi:hypothetical protein
MAVKVSGDNVILYKIDTSTIPATETVFACARGCTFESQTELAETTSAANAWFKEDKDNLSAWTMSLDGIVTLDNFSYEDIAQDLLFWSKQCHRSAEASHSWSHHANRPQRLS